MANEYLGLSLFVMLLSFFIILNSMSEFEDTKAIPILNSLDHAFSRSGVDRKAERPAPVVNNEAKSEEGNTIQRIEGFFNARLKGLRIEKNRLGTEMTIYLLVKEFERALNETEQAIFLGPEEQAEAGFEGAPFLETLVSLVHSERAEEAYRMDMILNTGDSPAALHNDKPNELAAASAIISGYAQRLQRAGLPVSFMSIGLGTAEKDTIELSFKPYVPIVIPAEALNQEQSSGAGNE